MRVIAGAAAAAAAAAGTSSTPRPLRETAHRLGVLPLISKSWPQVCAGAVSCSQVFLSGASPTEGENLVSQRTMFEMR